MATVADYTSVTGGIMRHIGPCMKYANVEFERAQTTLPTALDDMASVLEAGSSSVMSASGRRECIKYLADAIAKGRSDALDLINQYGRAADSRLLDKTNVLTTLNIDETNNLEKVLDAIIEDLYTGSGSVKSSVYSVGSVTSASGNVGNGSMLCNIKLDGVSKPCQRYRANRRYVNVDSQLAIAETVKGICVVDSHGQVLNIVPGTTLQPNFVVGNELWYISGANATNRRVTSNPSWGSGFGIDGEGSGSGPIVYGVNVNLGTSETMLIKNNQFEYWTVTNTPDDWTIAAGAVTTNILNSTSTKFTGSSSLQFLGDGATTDIRITQAMSPQYLVGNRRYYLSFWTRGEASATGTSTVQFTGTGYTADSSEKVSESVPTSTSWVHKGFYITLPSTVPSDWALKIEKTGTPSAHSTWYDDICFQPVAWHGGLNFAFYNGDTPPTIGDYFTVPITQTSAGVIQEFCKRWWGVQFPSSATSPTISDSYAT